MDEYASLVQRAIASIIDQMLMSIIVLIIAGLGIGGLTLSVDKVDPMASMGSVVGIMVIVYLLWIVYYTYFEGSSGQTLGKKLMHIRVVRRDDNPMGFVTAFVRNVLRVVDYLPTLYILGLAMILLNEDKQRLGDMAANTVVIQD